MRKLNYYGQSRKAFYDKGKVMVNEPPLGGHFYVDDYEGLPEKIAEFEQEHDALVYAVIRTYYRDGSERIIMDSLLFVEDEKEEWESFDYDVKDEILFTYTINWTWGISEFGSIGFDHTLAAGLKRVG